MRWICLVFAFLFLSVLETRARPQQGSADAPMPQVAKYPNTSEGLQSLIGDVLQAAKAKESTKEGELIHSLLLPEDSTWFTDVYGPGFGASLAAAYREARPGLEKKTKEVYEGNIARGWMNPRILRYTDPQSLNPPLDHFLNCMNDMVPLYATAFRGADPQISVLIVGPGRSTQTAGDLDGYFVYDQGGSVSFLRKF